MKRWRIGPDAGQACSNKCACAALICAPVKRQRRSPTPDLKAIYLYMAEPDSRVSADHVLDRKPAALCHLIYWTHSKHVIIYVIADGRRDMGSLNSRRLLGA
jgi:hypothetical protein